MSTQELSEQEIQRRDSLQKLREMGINPYPAELYPYRSALWQKYLVESLGDSSIVRYMWEDYGLRFSSGEAV